MVDFSLPLLLAKWCLWTLEPHIP